MKSFNPSQIDSEETPHRPQVQPQSGMWQRLQLWWKSLW